jgi:hypothetical protein
MLDQNLMKDKNKDLCVFFLIIINIGVRVSLGASRLILQTLKLTIM